jgi:hypothetical protein
MVPVLSLSRESGSACASLPATEGVAKNTGAVATPCPMLAAIA